MITNKLIFPVWMMFLVPVSWAAIVPGIFLIALAGLLISLLIVHRGAPTAADRFLAAWEDARKGIWRAWLNLCAAYLAGTLLMLAPPLLLVRAAEGSALKGMADALVGNIYKSPLAVAWAALCLLATVAISHALHRLWTFRKTGLDAPDIRRAALWLASIAAPWLFLCSYQLYY